MVWFLIVVACFGGLCMIIWVCHFLTKSDMFGCQYVCFNTLTCDEFI